MLRTLTVQAYEDLSRPEGGHAIIVVHGLAQGPDGAGDKLAFRLRPLDGGAAAPWFDGGKAISARTTDDGVELVVGPDIADSEVLLPGTVVEIEFPKARCRGEFLWPNIAPTLRPKRRSIVVGRGKRNGEAQGEREKGREKERGEETTLQIDPSQANDKPAGERANATTTSASARSNPASGPAVAAAPTEALADVGTSDASGAGSAASGVTASANGAAQPAAREAVNAAQYNGPAGANGPARANGSYPSQPPAMTNPPAQVAAAAPVETIGLSAATDKAAPKRQAAATAVHIAAEHQNIQSGSGSQHVTQERRPSRPPQGNTSPMVVMAAIVLATLGASYLFTRQPAGPMSDGVVPAPPAGTVMAQVSTSIAAEDMTTSKAAMSAPSSPRGPAQAKASAPAAGTSGESAVSLFDLLSSGATSPRGVGAAGVDAAIALEKANAALRGPGRDAEEGSYWLKRFIKSSVSDERTVRVLSQLGSSYAEPLGRPPDYVKARLLWEIASAAGDPVAMCFLGLVHENGLGTKRDMKHALEWYERSKSAGGCPNVEEAIARVKP